MSAAQGGHRSLDHWPLAARWQDLKAEVAATRRGINQLAWKIRPPVIDELGFEGAIRQLLASWTACTNLRFDLHVALDNRHICVINETRAYRVLQEALVNVFRCTNATRVDVILAVTENRLHIIIDDDGRRFRRAFGADAVPEYQIALPGLRERLALFGGSLEIEAPPGKGRTLFIFIPLS